MRTTDEDLDRALLTALTDRFDDLLDGVTMHVAVGALANVLVECFGRVGESLGEDAALNAFASVTEQMQIELEELLDINISEQSH